MNTRINIIRSCKFRDYTFNDIEGWAKATCLIDNNECPCVLPPKNKGKAINQGCNKEYKSKTYYFL